MSVERASGIILRTRPLTETSLIVQWLTPAFGRIATVAKGARRPKSPFRGKLDIFFSADFSFQRSQRSELHQLREVMLRDSHGSLRQDVDRLREAAYAAALIEQSTETDTPLPGLFRLMNEWLDHLGRNSSGAPAIFAFEIKLLDELGLLPDFAAANLSAGAKQILAHGAQDSWETVTRLKLSPAQHREIRQFLHGFLIYHLGRIPAGRPGTVS